MIILCVYCLNNLLLLQCNIYIIYSARRLLQKKDKSKFSKLDDRTIRRLIKKLETDCTLIKNTRTGNRMGLVCPFLQNSQLQNKSRLEKQVVDSCRFLRMKNYWEYLTRFFVSGISKNLARS